MPDDSTRQQIPPPAPLVPRSLGGWLRPLAKALVAPLAVTGRQLVHAVHLDTLVTGSSARH